MFPVALLLLLAAGSYVKCVQLTQPASLTVQPGQRLSITCQVSYSVSDWWTAWIRQPAGEGLEFIVVGRVGQSTYWKDSLKNQFSIEFDSSNNRMTLIGQNMQPGDSAVYYCARTPGYGAFDYWGRGTTVTVTSDTTTHRPTVFPLLPCDSGIENTVTLGCMATNFAPSALTFSWNKGGTALQNFVQYPAVLKNNRYMKITQVTVPRQDWDNKETFVCKAELGGQNSDTIIIKPEPFYQEPTLKVLASNDENGATFACFAKDFSPKTHQFKWLKAGVEIDESLYDTKPPVSQNGTVFTAASFLSVNSLEAGTEMKCEFRGKSAGGNYDINSTLTYKPSCNGDSEGCPKADVDIEIIGPTNDDMYIKNKGVVICKVTINKPGVQKIAWEDGTGNEMAGASKVPGDKAMGPITLPLDVTLDEWRKAMKRVCVVEHSNLIDPQKKVYERLELPTKRPVVTMLPPIEHTKDDEVTLTCFVKDFFPKDILVTWHVDDEPADPTHAFNTTEPVERDGYYSVYSHLNVPTHQWERPGVTYSCIVHHLSLINNIKSIVRSVAYKESDKTNLVNVSLNIPDTCRAQ